MEALEAMTWYTSLHFDFKMLKSRPETNIYLVLKYLKYCSISLVLKYLKYCSKCLVLFIEDN